MPNTGSKLEANPYYHDHVEAETAYTQPRSLAIKLVNMEWAASLPYSLKTAACRCGEGTLWLKSTIARHKCDGCGTLAALYGTHPEYLQKEKAK